MTDNDDKGPKCPKCHTGIYTYGRPGSYETAVAEHVVGGMECDLIRLEAADLRDAIENADLRDAIGMMGHDWFEIGFDAGDDRWYWAKPDDHIISPTQVGYPTAPAAALAGLAAMRKVKTP